VIDAPRDRACRHRHSRPSLSPSVAKPPRAIKTVAFESIGSDVAMLARAFRDGQVIAGLCNESFPAATLFSRQGDPFTVAVTPMALLAP